MASILDYLLPKSFQSDLKATVAPDWWSKPVSEDEFGAFNYWTEDDKSRADMAYWMYKQMYDLGYRPTDLGHGILTAESSLDDYGYQMTDDFYNMQHEDFSKYWLTPEQVEKNMKINPFTQQNLVDMFERHEAFDDWDDFDPAMVKPMELSTLRKLDPGSYTREVAGGRDTLIGALARQRQQAGQLGSGFAGYGRRGLVEDLAQRQYQSGVEGIYENVNQQRAQALQDLYAQLGDYQSLIDTMEGN